MRLVLADWVQDHDDELEAAAIRGSQSLRVDLIPSLVRTLGSLAIRLAQLAVLLQDRPDLAAPLVEVADLLCTNTHELVRLIAPPPQRSGSAGGPSCGST